MAISLDHLDALVGYDPATHSMRGLPSMPSPDEQQAKQNDYAFDAAKAQSAIPSMNTAGDVSVNSFTGRPNSVLPISSLVPPTRQESHAAGRREYAAGIPKVDATPGTADYYTQKLAADDYKKAHPWGSDVSAHPGVWGKIGHVASEIGNTAGDIVAPGTMANIPGTEMNERVNRRAWTQGIGEADANELKNAETQSWKPMSFTAPGGNTFSAPMRDAGALGSAGIRAGTAEDIAGKRIGAQEDIAGKNIASREGIAAGANASREAIAANKAPQTIVMEDGGKPFKYEYDPKNTYSGAEGHDHWKKLGPAQPSAAILGQVGTLTPLIGPDGEIKATFNNKTGQVNSLGESSQETAGTATTTAGARLNNTKANQFNTQYVNPANQFETQYQRAGELVDAYNANPQTGAAGMGLFAGHLSTTLGGVKGAAIGEGAQKMHMDAIGLEDRLSRFMDYLKTGQPLSATQVHDFYDLIQKTRALQWKTTAREAARRKMPIDFLPADVNIRITSPDGKESQDVPAASVQKYVDKGGKIGY